ncbi:hypothetical protein Dimus_020938 [Dionaea muscipula]
MTVIHLKKKDVVKSKVRGVEVEFDHEKLATILGIPGNNGICEYVKDVWEESKYIKPLEITRSSKIWKRDTKSFMDLTYMDHPVNRRRINPPRVMMRHMAYVISIKDHESPYGDWMTMVFEAFGVPLVNKKGEEPKRYDYFEETFLTMCKLRREDGVWWIGRGENRRRDDDINVPAEEEAEEEEEQQTDFDWEAVIDEAVIVEGESGSGEKFYDAEEEAQGSPDLHDEIPAEAPPSSAQQQDKEPSGVDPSGPTSTEAEFLKFQAEFERKRPNRFHDDLEKAKAENARLLALLHQAQTKPHP